MTEQAKTLNGHEILYPVPLISAQELKVLLEREFGIDGDSPTARANQLKQLSVEGVAIMLERINREIQGSAGSLLSHDEVVKVGDNATISLEERHEVFTQLVNAIRTSPSDTSPERIGDVLALGLVLLHPFHDGNGRTARVIGLMFRDSYDSEEYVNDFAIVTEPRDNARERGGFIIYGYVPSLPEGYDQSNAQQVVAFLKSLLQSENHGAYTSCYGQAPLKKK